jgi:hypothetical protein
MVAAAITKLGRKEEGASQLDMRRGDTSFPGVFASFSYTRPLRVRLSSSRYVTPVQPISPGHCGG